LEGGLPSLMGIAGHLPLEMFYRVVLIFADTERLAGFLEHLQTPGEVYGNDYTFVGILSEEQIRIARQQFGAYVRAARESK